MLTLYRVIEYAVMTFLVIVVVSIFVNIILPQIGGLWDSTVGQLVDALDI